VNVPSVVANFITRSLAQGPFINCDLPDPGSVTWKTLSTDSFVH